jgi:hypothetical protein
MGKVGIACLIILTGCECWLAPKYKGLNEDGHSPEYCEPAVISAVEHLKPCNVSLHGVIHWHDGNFTCGWPVPVAGCGNDGGCNIDVDILYKPDATDTALGEELGHYIFEHCGKQHDEWMSDNNVDGAYCSVISNGKWFCRNKEWHDWIENVRMLAIFSCEF